MEHQEIIFPDYVKNDFINSEDKNGNFNYNKYKKIHTQETEKYLNEIGIELKEIFYMIKHKIYHKNKCKNCGKEISYYVDDEPKRQFCSKKCANKHKTIKFKKNIIYQNNVNNIYGEIVFPDYVKNDFINSEDKNGNFNYEIYIKIHTKETKNFLQEIRIEPREAHYMLKHNLTYKNKCKNCDKEISYYLNDKPKRQFCSKKCAYEYKKNQTKKNNIKKITIRKNNVNNINEKSIFPDYIKKDLIQSEDKNGKFNYAMYKKFHTQETEKFLKEIGIKPKEAHYMFKNDLHSKNRCLFCDKEISYYINDTPTRHFCSLNCEKEYKKNQIQKNNKINDDIIFPDYVKKDLINCEDKNGNLSGRKYKKFHTQETEKFLKEIGIEPKEAHYMLKNDLHSKNRCLFCDKEIPYITNESCRKYYCSIECSNKSSERKVKIKQTNIKKYGVSHPLKIKENKTKMILSRRKKQHGYDNFIEKIKTTNIILQSSKEEFYNSEFLHYQCKNCNTIFECNQTNINRVICPKCKLKFGNSIEEKEIYQFINSFYFDDIIENDRKILDNKELDMYIPEYKLAIEFNGVYWHSIKNKKNINYHQVKSLKCMNKQIKLFHINEYYWNIKQNLIKNMILYKFGIYEKIINANECVFQSILKKDREKFLTFMRENTLEQPKLYNQMYGFFNNDELIAVCYVENGILQYYFNYKYKIENGLERCIFLVDLDETYIKINLDYQLDDEILNNKFQFKELVKPTYNYFSDNIKYKISQEEIENNKYNLVLKNYDDTKSIEENLVDNNYYKVYNAGYVILKYQSSK